MHVLVAYASRHGATQGIAERIAETLMAAGLDAEVRPASTVKDLRGYDAFVIGSAAYMGHWLKDAKGFVEHNRAVLAAKPVWLFSSGPLGTEPLDEEGRDQKVAAHAEGASPDLGGDRPRPRSSGLLRRLPSGDACRSGGPSGSCPRSRRLGRRFPTATSATGRRSRHGLHRSLATSSRWPSSDGRPPPVSGASRRRSGGPG